MAKTDRTM